MYKLIELIISNLLDRRLSNVAIFLMFYIIEKEGQPKGDYGPIAK